MRFAKWITGMVVAVGACGLMVVGLSDLSAAPTPKPTNGTVSFYLSGVSSSTFKTTLTVKKPDRPPNPPDDPGKTYKELVNKKQDDCGANEIPGGHNFPGTTTAAGIGEYYKGLLIQAGFEEYKDFSISGGVINLYGVTKIDFGSDSSKVKVGGTSDSKTVPATEIPGKRILCCIRGDLGMDGCATLVGFGIEWNPDGTFTTTSSTVAVNFTAADTGNNININLWNALDTAGWDVIFNLEGEVEIAENEHGTPIYSLHLEVEYFDSEGHTENDDHWVIRVSD